MPTLGVPLPTREPMQRINSYVLDFFKQGSVIDVERNSGIKNAWQELKSFSMLLKAVAVALETGNHEMRGLMSMLAHRFAAAFEKSVR